VPGEASKVMVVSASGGVPEAVLHEKRNQEKGSWSPDGKSLVLSYTYWLEAEPPGLTLVSLATHTGQRLPGPTGVWEAAWSPDGRYIAARTFDSHSVRLFDVRTQTWSELLKSDVGYLQWSLSSRYLYIKRLGAETAILRVEMKSRKVEEIVSLKNLKNTGYTGDLWIGVAPDESPLFLLDTGTQEIYALNWKAP